MDPAKAGDYPEKKLGTFVLTRWLTVQVQRLLKAIGRLQHQSSKGKSVTSHSNVHSKY